MTASSNSLEPLGDFQPADYWQTHVNAIFYSIQGPAIHDHFQTFVSRDYRLAHALADDFLAKALTRTDKESPWLVHEWGVGNGNLAACFLSRLKEQDTEGRVYSRTQYLLCDYSEEILKGARAHPLLLEHKDRFTTIQIDAGKSDNFKPASADKIISNEIWDDLAAKVLLKHQGVFYEEYLQPLMTPNRPQDDWETLRRQFNDKDLASLAQQPDVLPAIHWERSFQRVDISDWPYAKVIEAHFENVVDEIPVPVNIGAFAALEKARSTLKPDGQGYTGMDYGMFSMKEVNQEGRPYFNLYGGQYTNMVNFELLAEVGKAVGFATVETESQKDWVGRNVGDALISVVDLVQEHPRAMEMEPWDRDLLMLESLHALNHAYKSPYKNKMSYPPMPGTPKKQKKLIAKLAAALSVRGVPDTVAYITNREAQDAFPRLRKLGYREKDLDRAFTQAPLPIAFIRANFC